MSKHVWIATGLAMAGLGCAPVGQQREFAPRKSRPPATSPSLPEGSWEAYSFFHVEYMTVARIDGRTVTLARPDGTRVTVTASRPPGEGRLGQRVAVVRKDGEPEMGTEAGLKAVICEDGALWQDKDTRVFRGEVRKWEKMPFCTFPIEGHTGSHGIYSIDVATVYDAATGNERGLMRDLIMYQPEVPDAVKRWPVPWKAWFVEWRWPGSPGDNPWAIVAAVRSFKSR